MFKSHHLLFILLISISAFGQTEQHSNAAFQLGEIKGQLRYPDSALNKLRNVEELELSDSLRSEYYRLKGSAFFYKGITDSAIIYFTSAMAQLKDAKCDDQYSLIANGLAVVLQKAELFEEAIENYTRALSCAEEQRDDVLKLKILTNLSILNREVGSIDKAWFFLRKAFDLSHQTGSQSGMAALYNSKGQIYLLTEQYDSAKVAFNQSLSLRETDDLKGQAICLNNLGYVSSLLDDYSEALEYYQLASKLRQVTGDLAGNASLFINIANIHIDQGNLIEAGQYLQNASLLNEKVKSPGIRGRILLASSELEKKRGDLAKSLSLMEAYIATRDSVNELNSLEKIASTPYTIALMEAESKVKRIEEREVLRRAILDRQRIINLVLAIGIAIFVGLFALLLYQLKMLSNLRKALTEERDNAKRSAEARRETLNAVVHELKTPMNAIVSLTDLIQREDDVDEVKRMTEILQKSSHRLLSTTNNVLTYSRVEEGAVQLVSHEENLGELLKDTCRVLEAQAKSKGLEFECFVDQPVKLKVDRSVLEIVMMNLIGNAIKYTDVGGIEVRLKANEELAIVQIKDTGLGISEDDLEHIFEPFFQSEKAPRSGREGTGLGLSICKYYSELIGADIRVESKLGEGSTFSVFLKR